MPPITWASILHCGEVSGMGRCKRVLGHSDLGLGGHYQHAHQEAQDINCAVACGGPPIHADPRKEEDHQGAHAIGPPPTGPQQTVWRRQELQPC